MLSFLVRQRTWARSWAPWLAAAAIAVGLLHFTDVVYLDLKLKGNYRAPRGSYAIFSPFNGRTDMSHAVPELWKPFLHDIDNATFVTDDGKKRTIPDGSTKWSPLGKRVVIIDADTRTGLSRGPMSGRQAGYLNHLHYALVHGYDYRFVQAPDYVGRHNTWVKVPIVKEALKTYDIVVFLDGDAIFNYPQLPLEWMMSYWNFTENTLIAMTRDPNVPTNQDQFGKAMLNTGFMITQQSERTQQMFADWDDCPSGTQYPKCDRWAYHFAHEQAAFSHYIRYDYNDTDDVRSIVYQDANGPTGKFITHNWGHKNTPLEMLNKRYSRDFIRRLLEYLQREKKLYIDASHYSYPLHNLTIS